MFFQALQQQIEIVDALAAADDFAIAFGRDHVHAQSELRAIRIGLEIECFHLSGIAIYHHRTVQAFGDQGFVGTAEIAAPLDFAAASLEALLRRRHSSCGGTALLSLSSLVMSRSRACSQTAIFQHAADYEDDQVLRQLFDVVERGVGHFRFHHPEFRQVAARFGFFGAEGGAKAIYFAEGHGVGFVVELAGLGEVTLSRRRSS